MRLTTRSYMLEIVAKLEHEFIAQLREVGLCIPPLPILSWEAALNHY